MLNRFHLVPEGNGQTDGQTDRQTDRFAISISRVSMLTRDKNQWDCCSLAHPVHVVYFTVKLDSVSTTRV